MSGEQMENERIRSLSQNVEQYFMVFKEDGMTYNKAIEELGVSDSEQDELRQYYRDTIVDDLCTAFNGKEEPPQRWIQEGIPCFCVQPLGHGARKK